MLSERGPSEAGRLVDIIKKVLPKGRALPAEEWRVRHRAILLLTWLHAAGLPLFGIYQGFGIVQSVAEGGVIAAVALAATWGKISRSARSAAASLALITSSAILVQFSGGYIEAHFHFFVMLAVISLYQDWGPYLLAIFFVVVEHGLTGQFVPMMVYNHPDAFVHPWKWAVIHAGFVLSESVVLLVNWRISEQARARVDLVLNSAGEAIIGLDLKGTITFANPAAAKMTGYSLGTIIGQPVERILQDAPDVPFNRGGAGSRMDKVVLRRDGAHVWVDCASNPILEQDQVVGAVVTLKDETDRRRAEEKLKKTLSLLSATLESTADGILVVDQGGKIERFNQKFIQMWNVPGDIVALREDDQALAHLLDQLKDPEGFLKKVRELSQQSDKESDDLLEFKDGRVFERYSKPQRIGGENVGRVWSFRDVTERKQLEAQLRHVHKLEAVGQLTGGVAHEFNNLLTAITVSLELAREQVPPESEAYSLLDTAHAAGWRAAGLTQQLLSFSRRSPIDRQPRHLGEEVEKVARLFRQAIDRRIRMETGVDDDLWPVLADAGQMNQLIMNLCVNARDALLERMEKNSDSPAPADWEPRISIHIGNVQVDGAHRQVHPNARTGKHVCLRVADNGVGIDEEIRHRIFEPFFTTKKVGRGTGLGLSAVYGIVAAHQGWIEMQSVKGEGTTFSVYFPQTEKEVRSIPASPLAEKPPADEGKTILVVDDEEAIRALGRAVLEHEGYRVLTAEDGREAVELFVRKKQEIDLVVLDLTMPYLSGGEVLHQLRQIEPNLKVIISSGHRADHSLDLTDVSFLQKPYRPADLLQKVIDALRQAVQERPPAASSDFPSSFCSNG
ncbi:MAG: PAS domain S-box protein [Candidatus Manganitrophus sp. SA1]|nr:PAS domain S-box protein [Candidatus Manganitrophus morganii]